MKDFIRGLRVAHIEKKLRKYKEVLLTEWRDELEEEYDERFNHQEDEIYRLKKVIADERHNVEYWHGKYDALEKVYDGVRNNMLQKVEDNAMKAGKQEEQLKNLKKDLKDKKD